jgi:DNA mismatch repair protein MutS
VAEGAASASYGVDVARLAGVPEPVVERSRELVAAGTGPRDRRDDGGERGDDGSRDDDPATETELGEAAIRDEVVAELRSLRIAETTPVEALVALDGLKRRLDDENH